MSEKQVDARDVHVAIRDLTEALDAHREGLNGVMIKPYGRVLLETAIPTAVVVVGVVAMVASVVFIDRHVGAKALEPAKS